MFKNSTNIDRDFVQLTAELVDNGDGHFSTVQNAECFVDSCSNGILSTAPAMTACQHIQATLNCHAESEILAIKSALIHSLNIPADFKDELWTVSTEDNQGYPLSLLISQIFDGFNFILVDLESSLVSIFINFHVFFAHSFQFDGF